MRHQQSPIVRFDSSRASVDSHEDRRDPDLNEGLVPLAVAVAVPPKIVWARDRGEWEDPARSEATERRAAPEPDTRCGRFPRDVRIVLRFSVTNFPRGATSRELSREEAPWPASRALEPPSAGRTCGSRCGNQARALRFEGRLVLFRRRFLDARRGGAREDASSKNEPNRPISRAGPTQRPRRWPEPGADGSAPGGQTTLWFSDEEARPGVP